LNARTHAHARVLVAEACEALDICDVEARFLPNLYKIDHYEMTVDKWDNFAEVIFGLRHKTCVVALSKLTREL
jgi:hypothetical protein